MEQLPIRRLNVSDISQILTVEQACHLFPWTEGILLDCFRVGYPAWGLFDGKEMLGYVMASFAAGECHILNVCVVPKARCRGFGRQLMETLLAAAEESGAQMVFLEVRVSNQSAINLYRKLGFNECGIRKNYYPTTNGREDGLMLAYQFFKSF